MIPTSSHRLHVGRSCVKVVVYRVQRTYVGMDKKALLCTTAPPHDRRYRIAPLHKRGAVLHPCLPCHFWGRYKFTGSCDVGNQDCGAARDDARASASGGVGGRGTHCCHASYCNAGGRPGPGSGIVAASMLCALLPSIIAGLL